MADKQRQISERSLENLKLGSQTRYQGKVRHNFTILPQTAEWLKGTGNASDAIDGLVNAFSTGKLKSDNTHDSEETQAQVSKDVYNQIEALKLELDQVRSQLEISRAAEKNSTELLCECHSDAFKAAGLLKEALKLKKSKKGGYQEKIEQAIELIDDV